MNLTLTERPRGLPLILISLPRVEELSGYTAPARPTADKKIVIDFREYFELITLKKRG